MILPLLQLWSAAQHQVLSVFLFSFLLPLLPATLTAAEGLPSIARGQIAPSSSAEQRFAEAETLLHQGDTERALAAAQAGLKMAPQSVTGLNLLGVIYGQKKDFPAAVAAFEASLRVDQRSAVTHTELGNIYFEEHKLDLAEREFQAACATTRTIMTQTTTWGRCCWRKSSLSSPSLTSAV